MSAFDSNLAGQIVADFTPPRPAKFQDLLLAKNVIVELRQKGASYRAIADLLTRHNQPTSKTAITAFCHEVLGEAKRSRKRPIRKKESVSIQSLNAVTTPPTPISTSSSTDETPPIRTRGPRIAQVRMLKPQNP
jgi:hypothetical protein